MATNRTLQFIGRAYGDTPVTITASINNTVVFNSAVETLNQNIPLPDAIDFSEVPVLFSVDNSELFPTDFSGNYPMTLTVNGGYGITVGPVLSNYTSSLELDATLEQSSIEGTTLTIGSVTSGTVSPGLVLTSSSANLVPGTTIVSGSGSTWTVNNSQSIPATTITGHKIISGNATGFVNCFSGTPANSEGTPDCRSRVTIDGATQVPPNPPSKGTWTWIIKSEQLLACDFNVGLGNVA